MFAFDAMQVRDALDIFGSIDASRGDPQNGWDTDLFPNSVEELTLVMVEILRAGGFKIGGFNFDAKVRRRSMDPSTCSKAMSAESTSSLGACSTPRH